MIPQAHLPICHKQLLLWKSPKIYPQPHKLKNILLSYLGISEGIPWSPIVGFLHLFGFYNDTNLYHNNNLYFWKLKHNNTGTASSSENPTLVNEEDDTVLTNQSHVKGRISSIITSWYRWELLVSRDSSTRDFSRIQISLASTLLGILMPWTRLFLDLLARGPLYFLLTQN